MAFLNGRRRRSDSGGGESAPLSEQLSASSARSEGGEEAAD